MKSNEILRDQIFEIIHNQMKGNNPPETKITYDRLMEQGYTVFETKQLIGQCIAVELFQVLKFNKSFDEIRYIRNLNNLPQKPIE